MPAFGQGSLCPLCHKPKTKCICKPKPKQDVLTYTIEKDDRNLCEIDEYGNLVIPRSITKGKKTYNVTSIGSHAFSGWTSVKSIDIPNGVTTIGYSAFSSCTNLSCITIPSSVTKIEMDAFKDCTNLTSINIPKSVKTIESFILRNCPNLTSITIDKDNPIYDSREDCNAIIETKTNTLIAGCRSTIIPSGIIRIGAVAFCDCTNLTNIKIPASVKEIGVNAFSGCKSLTYIDIPKSLTSIKNPILTDCTNLTRITVEKDNPVYDSRDSCNAIIETKSHSLVAGCQHTIIPNSVLVLKDRSFSGCINLISINIPSSINAIESSVFEGCNKLQTINFYSKKPPVMKKYGFLPFHKVTIHVPQGYAESYKIANYKKNSTIIDDL